MVLSDDRMYTDTQYNEFIEFNKLNAGSAKTNLSAKWSAVGQCILLITPLERFYGMANVQMKAAFAEWLKRWIKEKYGIYPVSDNNYKPYRRFTEYIQSNYATVKSWLTEHSFPDDDNILRLCELRGGVEIGQFWIELQQLNKELNREQGVIVPEVGKTVETAEELLALSTSLPESERLRFIAMLASQMATLGNG